LPHYSPFPYDVNEVESVFARFFKSDVIRLIQAMIGTKKPWTVLGYRTYFKPDYFGAATFSITTFSIMTLSIMTLSIMTLSIMTLSTMTLSIMTLSRNYAQQKLCLAEIMPSINYAQNK
jgi:hypothetical protein